MTRSEWSQIVQTIEACWPHREVRDDAAALWFGDLAEFDADTVHAAVMALYRSGREFMPNGAQIRAEIADQTIDAPEFGVAWARIIRAIQSYGSNNQTRVLAALEHPAVRELAELTNIREIGLAAEGDTTLHAQARERYRAITSRHKQTVTHAGLSSASATGLRGEEGRAPRQIGAAMTELVEGLKP